MIQVHLEYCVLTLGSHILWGEYLENKLEEERMKTMVTV